MHDPVLVTAIPVNTDRRRLTILVGVGLVLALLLLVVPRLGGGGGGADLDPLAQPFIATTPTTSAPAARALPVASPASAKDPFKPLVAPRAPDKAAPPVAVKAPARTKVRLTDVYVDPAGKATAKLKLDASDLTVKAGQQFGGSYRVLDLDVTARCGNFLFGDQPFSLCAGEETTF